MAGDLSTAQIYKSDFVHDDQSLLECHDYQDPLQPDLLKPGFLTTSIIGYNAMMFVASTAAIKSN